MRELRFRQRFNATVLAVNRANSTLRDRLGRVVLREGDMLLLQAPLDALRGLQQSSDLVVLDQLDDDLPSTHRKGLAISVMLAVLLLAGFKVMPLGGSRARGCGGVGDRQMPRCRNGPAFDSLGFVSAARWPL